MKKKLGIFRLLFIFVCLLNAYSYAEDATALTTLISDAAQNNLDLQKQELATQAAADAIVSIWKIDESKITVSGNYNSAPDNARPPASGDLAISVPILAQLALSARISQQSSSLTLSINPLNFDTSGYKAQEAYAKALNQLASLKKQTAFAIEKAVLDWNMSRMNQEFSKASYELAGDIYEIRKQQYALGVSSYDELLKEEQTFLTARQKYYDSQKNMLRSQQTIYALLGSGMEGTLVPEPAITDLQALITARKALVSSMDLTKAGSEKLKSLNLELGTLEKERKELFPIQPVLGISADLGLPDLAINTSASISLTAKNFKFKDIADLKTNINLKKSEIETEKYKLSLDTEMLLRSIQIANEIFELSKKDIESATTNSLEAEFLYKNGERTIIEVRQAALNKQSADIRLYQGAIGIYSAQADYLMLF